MNQRSAFEIRVTALISAYADRAPTDVDPMAIARLVAGSRQARAGWFGVAAPSRALVFAVVALALLASIASSVLIVGAGLFRRDPIDIVTGREFVAPFSGLPPEGAAPSTPEQGELVLSFGGRVKTLGGDFHRMWLYADGRLLWRSNLEPYDQGVNSAWRQRFGGTKPTTAVIEQHLTAEGVDLIRSDAMASARILGGTTLGEDPADWARPGVIWGGLTLSDRDRLLDADWSDARLPGRLANPGSWLPLRAWADRRIGAYVPSRYAMCVWPIDRDQGFDRLPALVRALVLANGATIPGSGRPPGGCHAVTTDVARAIVAAFDASGHRPAMSRGPISYVFPEASAPDGQITVDLLEVTPHGEVVCNCG